MKKIPTIRGIPYNATKCYLAKDFDKEGKIVKHYFETNYENIPTEGNYYEVAVGEVRRIYFDFDSLEKIGLNKFIVDFTEALQQAVYDLFEFEIDEDDLLFCDSSTSSKTSFHVILPDYSLHKDEMKLLYKKVKLPYKGLDKAVYGSNQCFRLVGCSKIYKDNIKKIASFGFKEPDTYITDLTGCERLVLRKEIQEKIDLKNEMIWSPPTVIVGDDKLAQIVMNLNPARADDFMYWKNICIAIGFENGGLDLAMSFSKQSSKFNYDQTKSLYDAGNGRTTNGRPITIGTLFAYLKEDNLELFREITYVNRGTSENIKIMIDNIEQLKLTNEEKLAIWLGKPEFHFHHKVSNASCKLTHADQHVVYEERFMKEYPNDETLVIKAEKGQGKTYQLEKYIEANNPEFVLFVSFRRSLSNELMKRLAKHGFVSYQDIAGPITNKYQRVVIQVDSLHRIKWTNKCELLVCDEIESLRSQFFADTCKFKNACLSKYEMLLESAKQCIFMDADISENTMEHIKANRNSITYIENTYRKIQSEFKEFYTTKRDVIFSNISKALDNKEKIVIACNRAVIFMEAIKAALLEKYDVKVLLLNSKTMRDPEIAAAAANTDRWQEFDVVIYSPTISAGVSVDYTYFDKFFGYFTNNGKINSMRQMINRVRKYKTNEFYLCLEQFGGSCQPQDFESMERHICSNRFMEKPEFILSKEKHNGSRSYPYKNTAYYLWIYNQIEINRDKNLFLYNFLREQYHCGVGSMKMMKLVDEMRITAADVDIKKCDIEHKENMAIASADFISDTEQKKIQADLQNEVLVSEEDMLKLKKKNLLDFYDLPEMKINELFVETFANTRTKSIYKNRKKLDDLENVAQWEARTFNALCADESNVADDLETKYVAYKLGICKNILEMYGFTDYRDTQKIENPVVKDKKIDMARICDIFGIKQSRRPDVKKWTFRRQLDFYNSLLGTVGVKIKKFGNTKSNKYAIEHSVSYSFTDEIYLGR